MKTRTLVAMSFLAISALNGCAVAPLTNPSSARSLGNGEFAMDVMAVNDNLEGIRLAWGLGENFDLGIEYEQVAAGLSGKYSILNQRESTSFAVLGGAGSSGNGSYFYGGAIVSHKLGIIEPFALGRFNHVSYEKTDLDLGDIFGQQTIEAGSYNYFNLAAGATIWPADWFGVNLALNALTSGSPGDLGTYFTGGLLFRF